MTEKLFAVEIDGVINLSVDEIWPDGDAPENPTTEDVVQRMRDYGDARDLTCDWDLPYEIRVDGKLVVVDD